jgi:hypothetical protein
MILLYRVKAPKFVAGLEASEGWVVKTAPILKYLMGWSIESVVEYCQRKGWSLEGVEADERQGDSGNALDARPDQLSLHFE